MPPSAKAHRPVTVRMLVVSVVAGVVLAVGSVPVTAALGFFFPAKQWVAALEAKVEHADYLEMASCQHHLGGTRWFTSQHPFPLRDELRDKAEQWRPMTRDPRPALARAAYTDESAIVYCKTNGWPLRAAAGGNVSFTSAPGEWGLFTRPIRGRTLQVPFAPIWPGLLANTLFYATLTLALLAALRAWRTRRRRAWGRCVACGYERGDGVTVCPECGLGCS